MATVASPKKALKIVRIIARLNIGGPAIQACLLHQRLYPEFETVLATGRLDKGEGDMSYLLESERGVEWVSTMSRPVRLASDFATFVRLWRLLRRERPDIVHTHTAKAGTLGRMAALLADVPVVVHTYHGHIFRGEYFSPAMTRVFLTIERVLNRFTKQIVTVSESQARELAEEFKVAPRSSIVVIPNGFDLSRFPSPSAGAALRRKWGVAADQVLVVWAGRMVPVKNVEMLGDIIALAKNRRDLKFVVVGDGTEREKLEQKIGGCDNARLTGWENDMAAVWSAADIALLTSRNEGTPTSLIEAMAAGKPFVSTSAGGVRDLLAGSAERLTSRVSLYDNGLIFETGEDAVAALDALRINAALRCRLGTVGRQVSNLYSSKRLLEDYVGLYSRLCGVAPARPQVAKQFTT